MGTLRRATVIAAVLLHTTSATILSSFDEAKLLRVDAEHETIGIDQAEFSPKNAYRQNKDPFS